jgi:DNA-binding winged helix-turn-helix (wHTH) protein
VDFRILGRLEVVRGGQRVQLGGEQQRALLAYLLLHTNEPVRMDAIVSALWVSPPRTAEKIVQIYVSRLRRAFGAKAEKGLRTEPHGYRLAVDREHVDLYRFEDLVDTGRKLRSADLRLGCGETHRDGRKRLRWLPAVRWPLAPWRMCGFEPTGRSRARLYRSWSASRPTASATTRRRSTSDSSGFSSST